MQHAPMSRARYVQENRKMRFQEALDGWTQGRLTQAEAALLPGQCERSFRRHIERYQAHGAVLSAARLMFAPHNNDDAGAGPRRFPRLIPMGDDGRHEEVRPCRSVPAPCPCRAHHPLAEPARAPRGCCGLGALRGSPTRADHAVPPGAAARGQLHRAR